MSTFDPAAFEQMTIDQANETKSTPVPEGDYTAIVDSAAVHGVEIKSGERAGQTVPVLQVIYHLQDDDGKLKKLLNRDKVTVRDDVWLDLTESGALAFGPNQNVRLGKLREACNLNKPGKPFTMKMLEGQGPVAISVTQITDKNDSTIVYNRVARVGKAS